MAILSYQSGSQIVKKFENVQADFPANGISVADVVTIGVNNASGANVFVEYTLDSPADIAGGTAVWINTVTIATATNSFIVTEYGPTGVRIRATAANAVAWIKS